MAGLRTVPVVLVLGSLAAGCGAPEVTIVAGAAGDPIAGLDATLTQQFEEGQSLFDRDFSESEGLGPVFNQFRCSSCHDVPVIGGGGVEFARKATTVDSLGVCDPLEALGGPLIQSRISRSVLDAGGTVEVVPATATHRVDLNAPPLYALGLVESVPADSIIARADPDDRDRDGVSGRVARTADGAVGRFGLKAEHATVRSFVTDALVAEMGLTSADRPIDPTVNDRAFDDGVADPEVSEAQVDLLVAFSALLGPVARRAIQDPDSARDAAEGERLFESTGCASCHTPMHTAGPGAPAAVAGFRFPLYSDLLLHDLGPSAEGHCTPVAGVSEWRTAPLAGLRHRTAFFHDGRENSIERAIERHGGEAAQALAGYQSLSLEQRALLLLFLTTL